MTLREAEKAVLEAAVALATEPPDKSLRFAEMLDRLVSAATRYRHMKASRRPRVKCFCGKEVSVEGDHLRYHITPGRYSMHGHAPMLTDKRLPTAQPRGGGNEEG